MIAPAVTAEMVIEMKQDMEEMKSNAIALQQHASATDMDVLRTQIEAMLDTKMKTALARTSRPAVEHSIRNRRSTSRSSRAKQSRTYQESRMPKDTGVGVGR